MATTSSKKGRREAAAQRSRTGRRTRFAWIALLVAVALGLGVWFAWREAHRPGESIADLGRAHVSQDLPGAAYNTSPPTSGPHASPTRWGEHFEQIPHVNQVHNLEHGGVLIQYNCEHEALRGRCGQVRQDLREALRTAREEIDTKVILAPYTKMERPIALTAWTRLQYLAEPEREAILRFIRRNINRAPEQVE